MTLYEVINQARSGRPVVYRCKRYDKIGSVYMTFADGETVVSLMRDGKVAMIVKDAEEIYDCDKFLLDVAKMMKEKKDE